MKSAIETLFERLTARTLEDTSEARVELAELVGNLAEYGGHKQGCNYIYNPAYGCKCGWLEVEQFLERFGKKEGSDD